MYIKGHPRLRDMHNRETRNPIDNNYYVCTRIYKQKVAHHTSFSILCLNGSHFATPEMNSVNDTSRKINNRETANNSRQWVPHTKVF